MVSPGLEPFRDHLDSTLKWEGSSVQASCQIGTRWEQNGMKAARAQVLGDGGDYVVLHLAFQAGKRKLRRYPMCTARL